MPDEPKPPGTIFSATMAYQFRLGVFDCPHCGVSIHVRATAAGPTAEPATAECPTCRKPIHIVLEWSGPGTSEPDPAPPLELPPRGPR